MGSGIVDVETDIKATVNGEESLRQWCQGSGLSLPRTWSFRSGGGGIHRLFSTGTPIPNSVEILPGVDARGEGGYCVLPPSIHPNGKNYEWLPGLSPRDLPVASIPFELFSLLKAGKEHKAPMEYPSQIPEGERNDTLFKIACSLREKGLTKSELLPALMAINEERCSPSLDMGEVELICNQAAQYDAGTGLQRLSSSEGWPHLNAKGVPINHWENTAWLCGQIGYVPRYNEMKKDIESGYAPYQKLSFDAIVTDFKGKCAAAGYRLSKTDVADHIIRIAEGNKNSPVRDYLADCCEKWDGISRVREAFNLFELDLAARQDPEFLFLLFQKWLITCARMPFNKGEDAAQGVLVLIAPQGAGKTRWMYKLLPDPSWGKSGLMIDLREKDSVIQALQYWIVELGEYGRNLTAEKSDHYKAFITNGVDVFRKPYARSSERHPRSTVFYASTDTDSFLNDDAGERRNWTIQLKGVKDAEINVDQLWGEVAHMALIEKRPHWLTREEIESLNRQNETYKIRSAEYEQLTESLNWEAPRRDWIWLTSSEVCMALCIDTRKVRYVGRALTQLQIRGIEKEKDTSRRKYFMPPFTSETAMLNVKMYAKNYKSQAIEIIRKQ
jgi:hypothetical protein